MPLSFTAFFKRSGMAQAILGISAFYHDSAAALLSDGQIIAAAQEERFTRVKHDSSFPVNAVRYVLTEAGLNFDDLDSIAFYDKPFIKFERLLETYHAFAPIGFLSFSKAMPLWIKEKLFFRRMLWAEFSKFGNLRKPIFFPEHHLSHAASAFYPSPFEKAAILTIDGVGEWATTTIAKGAGKNIEIIKELHFPHSIGLLYSTFTAYCGFSVNSGEYKLMGLAPYGDHDSAQTESFIYKITSEIVDIREDGSILLNMDYFKFATGLQMANDTKWTKLFGLPPRLPESEISQDYMNMALAIQQVTEKIVTKLATSARFLTQERKLVMAGGVALNCVANGRLLKDDIFDDIWIQPAAGDAGGAVGAAYAVWHIVKCNERIADGKLDSMKGLQLGPEYSEKEIIQSIQKYQPIYATYDDFTSMAAIVAEKIDQGNVVGWFHGRMEFGPRALGNRSILADTRNPMMQRKLNLKIKFREGFRPFAPVVLEEDLAEYFDSSKPSPYMLFVYNVKDARRNQLPDDYNRFKLFDRLYFERSDIPAITHIDYSARVQSVNKDANPKLWLLLNEFKKRTGYSILVNTSFNVRGEPIVCTPLDAFRCFMTTEMDFLVMGNLLFDKNAQPPGLENLFHSEKKID